MLTGADTNSGATTVNQGTLALGGSSAAGNGSSAVTVFNGATYDLSASTLTSQAFGSLSSMSADGNTGGGTVILAANSTLTVGSNNNSTTFNGVIKGSGAGLTKAGTGDLSLGGSNTYTGSTLINAGILTLTLGGAIQGSVNVGNGSAIATLEGSGTVGNVTVNSASASDYGILAAGIVIGGPYTIASAGTLTTGNLTLSGANAQVDFLLGNSALAGTTYSTIVVNGNLTLGNALLNLTALPDFSPGTYDLFSYSGTESGTLTLGSLPNGYTASQISISYGGGSVDLVATAKPVPEPATWAALLGGMLMLAGARARRGPRQGIV
jgi:autotransporter-associated beta strand protein